MHWFMPSWWRYLLMPRMWGHSWPAVIWCRMHGHPPGPRYYNMGGLEPDWHCKGCGDNIG